MLATATMSRDKSDSLMDAIFSAVELPAVGGGTTIHESHVEESHTFSSSTEVHHEHHEHHVEYTTSGVTVGDVVSHSVNGTQKHHDNDDNRSEASAFSKATSVSVHSSVSQKSAQHYDVPPTVHYDIPPIVIGGVVRSGHSSVASSKSSSKHSAVTHDSESTISDSTIVGDKPVVVGGVVGVSVSASTPVAVGQSAEHDAVLDQFKDLHGKRVSIGSSVVPASVNLVSDSEDSIAPSKLTASIVTGGIGMNVLQKANELVYSDFITPVYAPSVKDQFDTRSVDSFGFEHVEYVDNKSEAQSETYYHDKAHDSYPEDHVKQVVVDHVIEQQRPYEPYHSVFEHHETPTANFDDDEDHHSHHTETNIYTHVTEYTNGSKNSRSNTESTYRNVLAHNVGPKITEELRSATVYEEDETHVEPPVLAYVAPTPLKPPRVHSQSQEHIYDPYSSTESYQHHQYTHTELVKSTTVVHEDIRNGPGTHNGMRRESSSSVDIVGVQALRLKFENGVPPPLTPVLEVQKLKHADRDHHHHHHHEHDHHHDHRHHEEQRVQNVSQHVQIGGSRKSTAHSEYQNDDHHKSHHEHHHGHHHNDNHHEHHHEHHHVSSEPNQAIGATKHHAHSRTSTVSTVRSNTPVQRVIPTVQHNYGDHQSVRVVKNVREYVHVFGSTHNVPPPTPLAGIPRLSNSPRTPLSPLTFQQEPIYVQSVIEKQPVHHETTKKSVVQSNDVAHDFKPVYRKSTVSSVSSCSSTSSKSTIKSSPILVGGNIQPRTRQSTLTQDNVNSHLHEQNNNDDINLISVSKVRQLFENYGPAHLPEYASCPLAH